MTLMTSRIWLDSGRLFMVPLAAGFLLFDGAALVHGGGGGAMQGLTTALVCAFYALIIWCYLRRGPALATGRSVTAHAAAVIAMMTPFAFPLLRTTPPGAAAQWAGNVLLAAGTGWAVWSLRSLGRNVSVIAQARKLVVGGPYRWVRHPLYTGEIVSSLGLALTAGRSRGAGRLARILSPSGVPGPARGAVAGAGIAGISRLPGPHRGAAARPFLRRFSGHGK